MSKASSTSGSTFTFRIDPDLKTEFMAAVEEEQRPVSQVLRDLMATYIERKRRRQFTVEARRQSLVIASTRSERETMDWVNNVADTEGWK